MEIILLDDISGLGKRGATVRVADGYARNYLLPRNKAILAVGNSTAVFRDRERAHKARVERARQDAMAVRDRLSQVSLQFAVQVGDEEQLYGSVSASDVHDALAAQGFDVEKKAVRLDEPIKALGAFDVPVHVFQDIEATVKVWVVRQ